MSARTGLWRHTDFLILWTGQTLSALGSTVTTLALPLTAALILHASAFEMGLLSTVATVPNLLFGLVAGVSADRVRRRPLMISAEISRALLLLSIPIAALVHRLTIGQLYAVVFLAGTCTTFFEVANVSYLPSLVGRDHVVSATSRLVASASVAMAVGPGVAGGLIQIFTAPIAIFVDAFAVAVSAVLVLTIRSTEPLRGAAGRRRHRDDAVMGSAVGESMATSGALLLGRRTYEDFYAYWPHQPEPNPFTAVLTNAQKYIASTTLEEPLPWRNSTLLKGDAAEAVARLKEQPGKDLVVLGSGELVQSLMRRTLVDEYVLLIHPLVLGAGRRLFTDGGAFAALRLVDAKTTATGVLIATYQRAEPTAGKTS